ncbi:MAG: ATP-binding protein [Alphaproteobacteria bacterium]
MSLRLINLKKIMSDLSANIFLVVDKEGKILDYNAKACNFLGTNRLQQREIREFFDEYALDLFGQYANDIHQNQLSRCFVLDIKGKLYDCCIYPYSFGYVLSFDDITEFREFASYTGELTKRIQHAEKVSSIGYFEIDLIKNQKFYTKELFEMLGYSQKNNKNIIEERVCPKDLKKLEKSINKILEKGEKVETTMMFMGKNDEIINCMFKASLVRSETEYKIVGTIQDLTNYLDSRKNLKEAKKKAEDMSKAKSYFIVQASHDLRQPLQAIRLFVHRLKNEKMSEHQNGIISSIDSSVEGLSYLLDNLMDISKLDYGGMKSHPYMFDLEKLVSKLEKEFKEIALTRGIHFEVKKFSQKLFSDSFFVERIIRNFLSNAFKFTKSSVVLGMEKRDEKYIRIYVTDDGQGISKKELEYIFNEFYQSKNIKKTEGIGLGLPIVKKMSEALSAKINVESKLGKGSCFSVDLPINEEPE